MSNGKEKNAEKHCKISKETFHLINRNKYKITAKSVSNKIYCSHSFIMAMVSLHSRALKVFVFDKLDQNENSLFDFNLEEFLLCLEFKKCNYSDPRNYITNFSPKSKNQLVSKTFSLI